MTLRLRVALFISAIFALLAVSMYLVFNETLMGGFLELENQSAHKNAARALESIKSFEDEIALKAEEWGMWDDTYEYIQEPNDAYATSNLTFEALNQLKLRHFVLADTKGKVVKALYVDKEKEEVYEIDSKSIDVLSKVLALALESDGKMGGLVEIDKRTFLVGASRVTNSAGDAPARGTILLSRDFDEESMTKLKDLVRAPVRIAQISTLKADRQFGWTFQQALGSKSSEIYETDDNIYGIEVVRDIFGAAIHGVVVTLPRDLLARGIRARNVVTLYVLTFTVVALTIALYLINRIVITPLRRIGAQSKQIGEVQSDDMRVDVVGDREMRELGEEINKMLNQLARSKQQVIEAKKSAESANYAKSRFIARVSHELRNPVHGIRGINDLVLKRESSSAVKDLVRMGDLAAASLITIVDEILDFSKAEAGELIFEKIPYDIRRIVRETMQVAAARLEGKSVTRGEQVELICDVDPSVPQSLEGDPTRLKQILINLLTNAVKFTENGYVGLRLAAEDAGASQVTLKMKVWDTGIGVPQDKISTLFTPFKQVDETVTRKYQGTGLGLSIVKQFTEGLGGTVSVSSVPGKGSTFSIALPQKVAGEGVSLVRQKIASSRMPAATMLIARVSPVSSALAEALDKLGAQVTQIDPCQEISEHMWKETHFLIVSEETIGDAVVWSALEERARSGFGCTVAMLRPASLELKEKLYALGIQHVFSTPVLADDLLLAYFGEASQTESKVNPEEPQLNFGRKLRILVVDDQLTNRIILQETLGDAGHEVVTASDGQETVDLVSPMIESQDKSERFDLIITDITMPMMNGDESARILRKLEARSPERGHIPIIAVTGHAFKEELEALREAGFDGVLTKPVRPLQLAEELMRLFGSVARS